MIKRITSIFLYIFCISFICGNFFVSDFIKPALGISSSQEKKQYLVKYSNSSEFEKIEINEDDLVGYENDPAVVFIEPNYTYQASIIPSDTKYKYQWYLERIKAQKAWDKVRESPDIVIAIVDSSVQIDHPDLIDNIWHNEGEIPKNGIDDDKNGFIDDYNGWDFINNQPDPSPRFDEGFSEGGILHGTIVSGVALASGNNGTGISGVTWKAALMPLRVLNDQGEGRTSEVIRAIDYASNNGADVINLSFVGFHYSQGLYEAIARAYDKGVIVVAAAGNEQSDGLGYNLDVAPIYPACFSGPNNENFVISVAATDDLDQKADFSSYGDCVDISAPGVSIFSTTVYSPNQHIDNIYFNKYYDGYWSGTSMAAPMISGAIALIKQANTKLDNDQVVNVLMNTSDDIHRLNPDYLNKLGSGRLNVDYAVESAISYLSGDSFEVLLSPQSDYISRVKIADNNGKTYKSFLAYGENFRGGVNVASGDVDGDGISEIITGTGFSGGPQVRIFDSSGKVKGQFFAYGERFRGGVNVASGDVDGDGIAEIITGAGFGGGPQVRIFDSSGKVKGQFFAFDSTSRKGVNITVADTHENGMPKKSEIIVSEGPGSEPVVRVYDNCGEKLSDFLAYSKLFRGGVNISAGDIDKDNQIEIISGAGIGGAPHVRIFNADGKLESSFYAFDQSFKGGIRVGVIELSN